jgi:hypothetical protein
MESKKPKRSWSVFLHLFLIFFLAVSGLIGGGAFIIKPDGTLIQMPLSLLDGSPFSHYLIPGIILFFLLGVYPAVLFCALIKRPGWKFFNTMNLYKDYHWAWTGSFYTGIMLILWIDFQILFIGYGSIIQTIYALLGVLTVVCTFLPSVQEYYFNPENSPRKHKA